MKPESTFFTESGLAPELGAQVRNVYRLAVLIFALVGDLIGLGLPGPRATGFEQSGDFPVSGVEQDTRF
jgi:hypothetical protein